MRGVPGFFGPRLPAPWFQADGVTGSDQLLRHRAAESHAGTADRLRPPQLRQTRLSVGAVNVRFGQLRLLRHGDADGSGPSMSWRAARCRPAFRPSRSRASTTGMAAWSRTRRCNGCLRACRSSDTLAFQVDLWSARGTFPRNLAEVATRQKEIQYSSRTRGGSDRFQVAPRSCAMRLASLLEKLPDELQTPAMKRSAPTGRERQGLQHRAADLPAEGYEGDSRTTSSPASRCRALAVRLPRHGPHAPPPRSAATP